MLSELFAPDLTPSVQGHTIITVFLVCDWFHICIIKAAQMQKEWHIVIVSIEIHYQHESSVGKNPFLCLTIWCNAMLRSFCGCHGINLGMWIWGNKSSFQSVSSPNLFISYCACVLHYMEPSEMVSSSINLILVTRCITVWLIWPQSRGCDCKLFFWTTN